MLRRKNFVSVAPLLGLFLLAGCSSGPGAGSKSTLTPLYETPQFQLTSEANQQVSRSSLLGKVWVVDFIFTRCAGPCPLMTQRMKNLQDKLEAEGLLGPNSDVRLVSITVDPEYDTPKVLQDYGKLWGADPAYWTFLTGPPDTLLDTIQTGFKVTAIRDDSPAGGMPQIRHSTDFLLVDKKGWVRHIGHLEDSNLENSMATEIATLLHED